MKQNRERVGFARLRWEETREGDSVDGARLTIETGAEFPIGLSGFNHGLAEGLEAELIQKRFSESSGR